MSTPKKQTKKKTSRAIRRKYHRHCRQLSTWRDKQELIAPINWFVGAA